MTTYIELSKEDMLLLTAVNIGRVYDGEITHQEALMALKSFEKQRNGEKEETFDSDILLQFAIGALAGNIEDVLLDYMIKADTQEVTDLCVSEIEAARKPDYLVKLSKEMLVAARINFKTEEEWDQYLNRFYGMMDKCMNHKNL